MHEPTGALVIVADDDPLIVQSIVLALRQEGYRATSATSAAETLDLMGREEPDLVILDIGLPDLSGVEVCRRIRLTSNVPILFLTARREDADKVVALDAGGDDFVTKPIGLAELQARVRAHLRRGRVVTVPHSAIYETGDIVLDAGAHRVTLRGREIDVTPREFSVLHLLLQRAGQAVRRRELLEHVWGQDWFGDDGVLDVYIRQLRTKIEDDPSTPRYIETIRGVGYRFALT